MCCNQDGHTETNIASPIHRTAQYLILSVSTPGMRVVPKIRRYLWCPVVADWLARAGSARTDGSVQPVLRVPLRCCGRHWFAQRDAVHAQRLEPREVDVDVARRVGVVRDKGA